MWQYLTSDDHAAAADAIEQVGVQAASDAPFAHLYLEPVRPAPGAEHQFQVVLREWPGGASRCLGTACPHGIPVTWT